MKRYVLLKIFIIVILAMMLLGGSIFAQSKFSFNVDSAYKYLKQQTDMGVRNYGSIGHTRVRKLIKDEMKSMGYTPNVHSFKAPYIARRTGENIYAFLKGKSDKYIVLASHYDTRSVAEKDPSFSLRRNPMVGANDGGSSTAVLLELMRVLKKREGALPYSIAFVFFDLEDDGNIYNKNQNFNDPNNILKTDWIQGSIMFAQDNIIPREKIYFGILIDLVGSYDAIFKYESYAYQRFAYLYEYVWDAAASLGYQKYFSKSQWGHIIDDHYPFVNRGIPFIDIIDMGYKYHHTHADSIDKIDKKSLEVTGNLLEYIVQNPPKL